MKWYEKLKFARHVKGVSLREVEKATGLSNAYLSQVENGKIKDPGFFTTVKLLLYYNLHLSDLLPYDNETEPSNAADQNSNANLTKCVQCGTLYLKGAMCHKCFGR